jgi:hypothetical protein
MGEGWNSMTTMTRGFAAPRRAVLAATNRIDKALGAPVDRTDDRQAVETGHGQRVALRREYAWIEAAANAAFRGRV